MKVKVRKQLKVGVKLTFYQKKMAKHVYRLRVTCLTICTK